MQVFKNARLREKLGKEAAKKYRTEGLVPAVAYGAGEKNYHLLVKRKDVEDVIRESHGETVLIELNFDGEKKLAFIQDIQRDKVKGTIIHVDFHIVHEGEKVEVTVPVVVVGQEESPGLKKGGTLDIQLHELTVWALPMAVPGTIEIDVSKLDIGDVVHVGDIKIEGVEFEHDDDEVILSIVAPRVEEEEVAEEAAEEGEEAEGAAPSEGEEG